MTHIMQRRDDASVWTSEDPVLFDGEAGHETDTGKWKLGDGATAWTALPYKAGVDSVAGMTGTVVLDVTDVSGAAPLASPVLTGNPTAPTPATADSDTSIATTAYVKAQLVDTSLTGNPTAPTPATADNDTSIATTAYVKAQLVNTPLTGNPTAPTPDVADNDTSIATTAYVKAQQVKILGRYNDNVSLIAFAGFPPDSVRYTATTWADIPVPLGTHYAVISLTADCRALTGEAQITYWLSAASDLVAVADLQTENHNNDNDVYTNLNASLFSYYDLLEAETLDVILAGSALTGFDSVSTRFTTLRVVFMGIEIAP